jgi:hypothetical protein
MPLQQKSMVLLVGTLAVGFALGLFADSTLTRVRRERRSRRPVSDRQPSSLSDRIADAIQPHSAAQLDSLRPLIQRVSDENAAMLAGTTARMRAHSDSLRVALAPLLDSAQRVRLDEELDRIAARGVVARGPAEAAPPHVP